MPGIPCSGTDAAPSERTNAATPQHIININNRIEPCLYNPAVSQYCTLRRNTNKVIGMDSVAVSDEQSEMEQLASKPGDIYVLRFRHTEEAIGFIESSIPCDMPFISISRTYPEKIRSLSTFINSQYYWLTNMVGEGKIAPASLGRLVSMVKHAADSGRKFTLFLDGIEYLIAENDFNLVLRCVNQIGDIILSCGCSMFINVDPNALTTKELAMLERTCGAKTTDHLDRVV